MGWNYLTPGVFSRRLYFADITKTGWLFSSGGGEKY